MLSPGGENNPDYEGGTHSCSETYIGRVTNGRRIDLGVYEEGAPQFVGAEDILVAKGKARGLARACRAEQSLKGAGH